MNVNYDLRGATARSPLSGDIQYVKELNTGRSNNDGDRKCQVLDMYNVKWRDLDQVRGGFSFQRSKNVESATSAWVYHCTIQRPRLR